MWSTLAVCLVNGRSWALNKEKLPTDCKSSSVVAVSCSILAWNYIQLPTPCSRIFKHRLPINQHSHLYPNDHHRTAHVLQHSSTMLSPYSNKSFFDDPSDIEMEDLSLPKQPLCIKKSLQSI